MLCSPVNRAFSARAFLANRILGRCPQAQGECRAFGASHTESLAHATLESAGRNSLVADKCDAHKTARGVRLELEQRANLFGTQIIGHSSLKIDPRTSNVQLRKDSRASIESAHGYRT